jgi:methenyltetrahydromethanopterin cyclohydrolase
VFGVVGVDFYQIDPMLFSPAKVSVTNLKSGRTFFAGKFNENLLNQSFGS